MENSNSQPESGVGTPLRSAGNSLADLLGDPETIFQAISVSLRDALIISDHMGNLSFWNEAAFEIFGYDRAEAAGKKLHELIGSEFSLEGSIRALRDGTAAGDKSVSGKTIELKACRNGGMEFPIEMSISPIIIRGHWNAICIIHDITDRKKKEEAIKRERILLRTLIDNLPDTIYIKDIEGRKVIANPADLKILGYDSESEVTGKTDLDMFDTETGRRGYNDDMAILREHKSMINREENFIDSDGSERWLYTTKMPLRNESDEVIGLIGIGRDITDRRKSEVQLALQAEELKELNATKDKFFSIIAHDMRSPFNAFLGLTKMLEEDHQIMTQEEITEFIHMMGVSADNLYRLLENLLEWSQLQRGLIVAAPELLQLKPRVEESIDLAKESARKKGVVINLSIADDLVVYADTKMFDGIMRNLSSNAIKFTPPGGTVMISARAAADNFVEVSVNDSGIGMNREMLENLFKIDINTSRAGTDGEPSSGLGLILCKEFAERNHGKLWVESKEDKGSTFYFTLPAK